MIDAALPNLIVVEANATHHGPKSHVNLGLGNVPDLKPEIVATRVKQVYEQKLMGREIMGVETQDADSVSWLEEQDMSGAVGWLTEEGGFPLMDTSYEKKVKAIKSFGGMFYVTTTERKYAKVNQVARKLRGATQKMRAFEDALIWAGLIAATGVNTFDGSNWTIQTGAGMGDPVYDVEHAKGLIEDATQGSAATDIYLTRLMYERLVKFDFMRNAMYTSSKYSESGILPKLCGLTPHICNAVDSGDAGNMYVLARNDFGFIAETQPLTVIAVPGLNIPNPQIDYVYYLLAQSVPVIDAPELVTKVTGLKA